MLALASSGCGGCSGAEGVLDKPGADVAFVREVGAVISSGPDGIVAVSLDGKLRRVLFRDKRHVQDLSSDLAVFAGSDSDTNLFLGDLASGTWRRIPALDGILSTAAISPDGKRVVASRHSDFDKPGSPNEDTLFFIDVASGAVDTLPASTNSWPTRLSWAADGSGIFVGMAHGKPSQWVALPSRKRVVSATPKSPLFVNPARRRASCPSKIIHDDFSTEIIVEDASGTRRVAVRELGRKRGFHDHQSDFGQPQLTPGCGYVLFAWRGDAWLADATGSGDNGPLAKGEVLFFTDPRVLSPAGP